MKKILVFETSVGDGGHHLEYLHHLYQKASRMPDASFVFAVPYLFKQTSQRFSWTNAKNVRFEFIEDEEIDRINGYNGIRRSFELSRIIKKYVVIHKINLVFLISLVNYLPFLPIVLPKYTRISGIIYNIYLYAWKEMGWKKRMEQVLIYLLMSRLEKFDKIFLLNDSSAPPYLNKLYMTNKFYYLPDPVFPNGKQMDTYREKLGIHNNEFVFLQCGMMTKRKSTLTIIDTISKYKSDENTCFVFAGKIHNEIKKEFYKKIENDHFDHHIVIEDHHLSYDEMSSLISISNLIFILYENVTQSSGFLGHAAFHNKPVMVKDRGLLMKIVKRYHLGYITKSIGPSDLASDFLKAKESPFRVPDTYKNTHRVEDFLIPIFE